MDSNNCNSYSTLEDEIIEIHLIDQYGNTRKRRKTVHTVKVSRLILTSKSDVFRAMLTSGMKESTSSKIEIPILPEDREDFAIFIRFLYHHTLPKSVNIGKFVEYADQYQITGAMEYVLTWLSSPTRTFEETQKDLNQLSHLFDGLLDRRVFNELKSILEKKFIDFEETWNSDDFLNLNGVGVSLLLSSEKIKIDSENILLSAAIIWFQRKEDKNAEFFLHHILPQIRFQWVTADYLNEICEYPLRDNHIRQLIEREARRALYLKTLSQDDRRNYPKIQPSRSIQFAKRQVIQKINLTTLTTTPFYAYGYQMKARFYRDDDQGYSVYLSKLWPNSDYGSYFCWSLAFKNQATNGFERVFKSSRQNYKSQGGWGKKTLLRDNQLGYIYKEQQNLYVEVKISIRLPC